MGGIKEKTNRSLKFKLECAMISMKNNDSEIGLNLIYCRVVGKTRNING